MNLVCLGSNLYTLLVRILAFSMFRLMPCEVAESKSKNKHQLSKHILHPLNKGIPKKKNEKHINEDKHHLEIMKKNFYLLKFNS